MREWRGLRRLRAQRLRRRAAREIARRLLTYGVEPHAVHCDRLALVQRVKAFPGPAEVERIRGGWCERAVAEVAEAVLADFGWPGGAP